MKIIAETPQYTLGIHEDPLIIHHTLTEKVDDYGLREVLLLGKDLLEAHGVERWVSDNRQVQIEFSPESLEWVETEWQPEVIAKGWKYWALVIPEQFYAQLDHMSYIESNYEKGIWVTLHTDVDAALKWARNADLANAPDCRLGSPLDENR